MSTKTKEDRHHLYDGASILETEDGNARRFMVYFNICDLTSQVMD